MEPGTVMATVGTAAIAAFVAGYGSRLRGHDEPGYRWLQWWAPSQHRATVRVVTATHVLVGSIATMIAAALGWYPFGGALWPLNGLIYAAVGEAIFRSDWSDFFLDAATPANSLLHTLLRERQAALRDMVIQRHVPIFLSKLDDARLLQLVTKLIEERFKDADEIALASKAHLLTALNIAGAALEGKVADEDDRAVVRAVQAGSADQRRRDALAWLTHRAVREIDAAQYRVPGFEDVTTALASIGQDLTPGPELFR